MRVLVAGGSGVLGAAVVERLLEAGAEVIGLIRDRAAAAAFVRHRLAGRVHIVHGRPDDLFRVHSALAVHDVQRVIYLPSSDAAGFDRGITTILEAVRKFDPRVPVVFPRSGSAASLIASPVPLGIARFDELFGRDPEGRGTIASAIASLLADERPITHNVAPRDFVHVRDAARACIALAEAVAKHPVPHVREARFRSGWQFTEREVFAAVREALGGRVPLIPFTGVPTNPLDWSPSIGFGEAIIDTVEWFRERSFARPARTQIAA